MFWENVTGKIETVLQCVMVPFAGTIYIRRKKCCNNLAVQKTEAQPKTNRWKLDVHKKEEWTDSVHTTVKSVQSIHRIKMTFYGRWLFHTGQFTIKFNFWQST